MTPAEAGAVIFAEPDWRALFEEQCARYPKLPRYLQEDSAFTEVLRQWRKWHWTPIEINGELKKLPAGAVEAIVALAKLEITPPRSAWNDVPRDGETGAYQRDDHCFLQVAGEEWRIEGIEDRQLLLKRMDGETKQIDLSAAKWDKHNAAVVELLRQLSFVEPLPASPSE